MVRASSPNPDIDDLASALEQLRLAQSRVDRVLSRLRSRSTSLPIAIPVADLPMARVSPLRRPVSRGRSQFRVGDSIRINRPSRNQQSEGVILGFTPSGFLQIRTADQFIVLRQPHNVTFLGRS